MAKFLLLNLSTLEVHIISSWAMKNILRFLFSNIGIQCQAICSALCTSLGDRHRENLWDDNLVHAVSIILQISKWRSREVKELAQSLTVSSKVGISPKQPGCRRTCSWLCHCGHTWLCITAKRKRKGFPGRAGSICRSIQSSWRSSLPLADSAHSVSTPSFTLKT